MAKVVKFDAEARAAMIRGVNVLAKTFTPLIIAALASASNFTTFAILFSPYN